VQTHTGDVVIERPSDLTEDWLTEVLDAGTVTAFDYERIGTGQMSECYRVNLSYAAGSSGPESVVLKVAARDPMSRRTGLAMGVYEREVRFYTDIAPRLDGPVARVHHARSTPRPGSSLWCSAMPHPPRWAMKSAARQSNRLCWRLPNWRGCMRG
jgi:Ecdysteroid kinase-like family